MELLEENFDVIKWPAYSADLNPIEKVWAIMKKKVVYVPGRSREQLIEAVKKAWSEITQ